MEYLFGWYCDLCSGVEIGYSEIDAWARLKRIDIKPYEVDAIMRMKRKHDEAIRPKEPKKNA